MSSVLLNSYFELFGLPEQFDVDVSQLTASLRELQKAAHPDRYATAPEHERRVAMQYAAAINDAYRTLKDPIARARYLLERHGWGNDDRIGPQPDTTFLMEQMEWREELAAARDHATLQALLRTVQTRFSELLAVLSHHFAVADFNAAQMTVRKLQFLAKLREEILDAQARYV